MKSQFKTQGKGRAVVAGLVGLALVGWRKEEQKPEKTAEGFSGKRGWLITRLCTLFCRVLIQASRTQSGGRGKHAMTRTSAGGVGASRDAEWIALAMALLSAFCLTACATVHRGTTKMVVLSTTPEGAEAVVDDCQAPVLTPAIVELSRGESHTVVFRKVGYKDDTESLKSSIDPQWIVVSLFGGTAISAAVDLEDGAAKDLSRDRIDAVLVSSPQPGAGITGVLTPPAPVAPSRATPSSAKCSLVSSASSPTSESAGPLKRLAHVLGQIVLAAVSGVLL